MVYVAFRISRFLDASERALYEGAYTTLYITGPENGQRAVNMQINNETGHSNTPGTSVQRIQDEDR